MFEKKNNHFNFFDESLPRIDLLASSMANFNSKPILNGSSITLSCIYWRTFRGEKPVQKREEIVVNTVHTHRSVASSTRMNLYKLVIATKIKGFGARKFKVMQ